MMKLKGQLEEIKEKTNSSKEEHIKLAESVKVSEEKFQQNKYIMMSMRKVISEKDEELKRKTDKLAEIDTFLQEKENSIKKIEYLQKTNEKHNRELE